MGAGAAGFAGGGVVAGDLPRLFGACLSGASLSGLAYFALAPDSGLAFLPLLTGYAIGWHSEQLVNDRLVYQLVI